MKPVAYHRLAASELIKSAKFYGRRNPTLGEVFLSTVEGPGQPAACQTNFTDNAPVEYARLRLISDDWPGIMLPREGPDK